jgi:predicted dehydrogenase
MAESTLALALVGCGGMGLRHLQGLAELQRAGLSPFRLVAVCDARPEAAQRAATMAEEALGQRPRIYTSLDDLLGGASGRVLDAVDLVTDVGTHHSLGLPLLQAGKHVLCEKPLGLTVHACRLLVDAASQSGAVLATAENYRRDPMNRLVAALLRGGAVGTPFMALQESVGGGRTVTITPWRHMKDRGGIVVDMGVHYTDLWLYFLGPMERINGQIARFEPLRYPQAMSGPMAAFYGSGSGTSEPVQATAEDTAAGQVTFASGALGQFLLSLAGHGEGYYLRRFYGSEGMLEAPGDRSGRSIRVAGPDKGGLRTVDEATARSLAPGFSLDEPTTRLFGASLLTAYELPFEVIDRRLLALELEDFGRAILRHHAPEVDGQGGLDAVAAMYAFFESAVAGRAVSMDEVASGALDAYQREINVALGLAGGEVPA